MSTPTPSVTVAELVLERPGRMRLFERLGIDYCCGGERPFADACRERGLDPATVTTLLDAFDEADERKTADVDWSQAPLDELCDHIVERHHAYLRSELPRLAELSEKTARVHGGELVGVGEVFRELRADLEPHLDEEEEVVFPACRQLATGGVADEKLADELAARETEHATTGALLARLREQTQGFDETRARCGTHRALLVGLSELERDLHEHIHEENNILFPRVLALAGR